MTQPVTILTVQLQIQVGERVGTTAVTGAFDRIVTEAAAVDAGKQIGDFIGELLSGRIRKAAERAAASAAEPNS